MFQSMSPFQRLQSCGVCRVGFPDTLSSHFYTTCERGEPEGSSIRTDTKSQANYYSIPSMAPMAMSLMPSHELRAGVGVEEPTGEGAFRCGQRSVDDFSFQGEAGRGAYGLVKCVRTKTSVSETRGEDLGTSEYTRISLFLCLFLEDIHCPLLFSRRGRGICADISLIFRTRLSLLFRRRIATTPHS
jgi:hypothetical protein